MSDLLGEALARADNSPHYDMGWQLDPDSAETIVAAARNWHTLTNGLTYWFCFDVGEVFEGIPHQCESGSSMAPGHEQCNWILGVGALTDTPEPE